MASTQVGQIAISGHVLSQDVIDGTLCNHTPTNMKLIKFTNLCGSSDLGAIPHNIPPKEVAHFKHLKDDRRSKAVVVYSMSNAASDPCEVLLAWDAPAQYDPENSLSKVYVVCGRKEVIEAMPLEEILKKLDEAKSEAEYSDKATNTGVHAWIHQPFPTKGNNATTLAADFNLLI